MLRRTCFCYWWMTVAVGVVVGDAPVRDSVPPSSETAEESISETGLTRRPGSMPDTIVRIDDFAKEKWAGAELVAFAGQRAVGLIRIVNDTDLPVTINGVKAGCGCTSVALSSSEIAVGAEAEVRVVVDRDDIGRKMISVRLALDGRPYEVHFISFVKPWMDLPGELDFRPADSGTFTFAKHVPMELTTVTASPAIVEATIVDQDERSARIRFRLLDPDHPAESAHLLFTFDSTRQIDVPVKIVRRRPPRVLPSHLILGHVGARLFVAGDVKFAAGETAFHLSVKDQRHLIDGEIVAIGDRNLLRLHTASIDVPLPPGRHEATLEIPTANADEPIRFPITVSSLSQKD